LKSKILTEIEYLYNFGQFDKLKEIIETTKQQKALSNYEACFITIFESLLNQELGDNQSALSIINDSLGKKLSVDYPDLFIRFLSAKALFYIQLGDKKNSLKYIKECQQYYDKLKSRIKKSLKLEFIIFLLTKANFYFVTYDYDKGFEIVKEGMAIAQGLNHHFYTAKFLEIEGYFYFRLGELTKSMKCFQDCIKIFRKIKNEYQLALQFYQLGMIYRRQGKPKIALKYMMEIEPYIKISGNELKKAVFLQHTSRVHIELGELDKAESNLIEAIEIFKKMNQKALLIHSYMSLQDVYFYQLKKEKAKKYYSIIKELSQEVDVPKIDQIINYREAVILMGSSRSSDRTKAEMIFREIMTDEVFDVNYQLAAAVKLCYMILNDFRTSGDISLLNELHSLTEELLKEAKNEERIGLRLEIYNIRLLALWAQAQYTEKVVDLNELKSLLEETLKQTDKEGLVNLNKHIIESFSEVMEQMHSWDDFIKRYYEFISK
jgi:tetratricopeptide (TPR) repeat protein